MRIVKNIEIARANTEEGNALFFVKTFRENPNTFAAHHKFIAKEHYSTVYGTETRLGSLRNDKKKRSRAFTRNNVAKEPSEKCVPTYGVHARYLGTTGVIAGLASKKLPSRNSRRMDARSFRVEPGRKWRSVTAADARGRWMGKRPRARARGDPCLAARGERRRREVPHNPSGSSARESSSRTCERHKMAAAARSGDYCVINANYRAIAAYAFRRNESHRPRDVYTIRAPR